jgi:dipeptidyl aminopeptidase/acylaminoacyl peptidase
MKFQKPRELTIPSGALGLAVAPDGQRLYAACMDGRIWEVETATGAHSALSDKHASFASGCALLPDGKTLVSAGYDGALIWHDLDSKKAFRRIQAHKFWSRNMALSDDGSLLATVTGQYLAGGEKYEPAAENEPSVKIYDTASGDLVQTFSHVPPVLSVAFTPDGQHVAAGNMMGEVRIWSAASEKPVAQFTTPDFTCWGIIKSPYYIGGIYGLAFSPDGKSILCCGMGPMSDPMAGNGKMTWQKWAWQASPAKMLDQIHEGDHGSGLMEHISYLPDGQSFIMAGRQAQGTWNASIFSARDGKQLATLDTKSRVTHSHFSPDGKTLILSALHGQGYVKGDPARVKQWTEHGRIHIVAIDA